MILQKYGNRKLTTEDGQVFDSMKEYRRYKELLLLQQCGMIKGLKRQVYFELLPSQKGELRNEYPLKYVADFVYQKQGKQVVEDVKGYKTKEYIIKRKLMKYIHNIEISEV